jgi:hypothetical protein
MEPTRMCGRCGGEMSAQGALYSAVRLVFRPQDTKFLTLQTGEVLTKAIMCRDCGLIEIVGDVNKLRHLTGWKPESPEETEP